MTLGQWFGHWLGDWFGPLEAAPEGSIAGSATITVAPTGTASAIGHMAGSASVTVGGSGALTGIAEASGTATVTINGTGTLTDTGGAVSDTRLDQILAILMGRKVYDSTTRLWRVYDSNGVELADPSGILLRGLHGWMLQQATLLADVAHDHDTDGGGFDAPYQAYVKKITAERAAEWRRTFERKQNEERQHPPTFDGLPGEWLLPRSTVKELPKVRVAETAPSWKRMFPSAGILRPASHIDDDDAALAAMAFLALLDD